MEENNSNVELNRINKDSMTVSNNNNNILKVAALVMAFLTLCGIGFGVYELVENNKKNEEKVALEKMVKEKEEIIKEYQFFEKKDSEEIANDEILIIEESSAEGDVQKYIYIGQWGIKIALPDGLSLTGYEYAMKNGYSTLLVRGVDCRENGRCQYAPEFSMDDNFSLGAIIRIHEGGNPYEGIVEREKMFTIDGYDYYYEHPQSVYSLGDEQQWEVSTVNLIRDMLTNQNNYSKI